MPTGMVIMRWDERVGVEIVGAYPSEVTIQEKTLMQLYSQHEFTGEAGLVSITAGAINLASYYTGPESSVYLILLLTAEEDGDVYEEILAEVSRQIVTNLDTGSLTALLPPLFQRLSVFPTLTPEQRLCMDYNSEIKRLVLQSLREEAAVSKSEIAIWLKDQYREGFVDVENVLTGMVKGGLAKISSVKGLSSDMVFMGQALMMLRVPPKQLIMDPVDHHLPESLKSDYIREVRAFFETYKPSDTDNLQIIDQIMLDPQCYEVLKLLREAMVTRNDLEKLRKKGVEDLDVVLRKFWENKMVAVFQDDKNNEYYCLVSDFTIRKYFPKHQLDTIREQYRSKVQNTNVLVKALALMKEEYFSMEKSRKKSVVAENAT
ncbi:MAG: hypothetical protein E4G98_02930 [Promethearchaeota archaeon]|nr:MAG: hypothetical protein E4G98_02930 [Candidatus Lokiarchaeota archaeon]